MFADHRYKPLYFHLGLILLLPALLFAFPAAGQDTDTVPAATREVSGRLTGKTLPATLRSIPDSVVRIWQKDKDFAYANDPAYWRPKEIDRSPNWLDRLLVSDGFRYFLLLLMGAILIYALVRIIADNNLRLFYTTPRKLVAGEEKDVPAPLEEDLEGRLQYYLQQKDFRQAVRYLYLKSLHLLEVRGLIRVQHHKTMTNREYLQQLGATPQRASFLDLTKAYENVWYGEFPLNERQFERLHHYFDEFYKTCRP
jgi:hypothetical protein